MLIQKILYLFPPFGVVSIPVMSMLKFMGLTLGLPILFLTPPNIPHTPQFVLTHMQPIGVTNKPPLGVTKVTPPTTQSPPKKKDGVKVNNGMTLENSN